MGLEQSYFFKVNHGFKNWIIGRVSMMELVNTIIVYPLIPLLSKDTTCILDQEKVENNKFLNTPH